VDRQVSPKYYATSCAPGAITPSYPIGGRNRPGPQAHALCVTQPWLRRGWNGWWSKDPTRAKRGTWAEVHGRPCVSNGLRPGNMLSGAQHVVPPLQLGVRGPPWRPHGVSMELEEASWATKKFLENSVSTLATTGDPRADVSAKGSCPQAPRGVTRAAAPTVF